MKQLLSFLLLSSYLLTGFISCKKDENRIYFEGGTAPVLTASAAGNSTIPLSYDERAARAITFNWTNPDYKFTTGTSSQDVTYNVEIDTAGANFSSARKKIFAVSKDLSQPILVGELNDALVSQLRLEIGKTYTIQVRVTATVAGSATTKLISNVLSYNVTPYDVPIAIVYMWMPGDYQGWAPGSAPRVGSLDGESFEGYVNFPANVKFKFASQPNWDGTNYGDGGGTALNTAANADNLTIAAAGFYRVKPNISTLSWSYEPTAWGLIGDATPGGWDNSTPFVYNTTTGKLEIASVAINNGKFKFRANNAWDINLGFDSANPDFLKYGGGDITNTVAGTYKVVLDLTNPHFYTYTLTKL